MAENGTGSDAAVILVGPTTLFREGLTRILAGTPFRVLASAARAEDLSFSAPEKRPTLIILEDAGGCDTASDVAHLREHFPHARIAVLAGTFDLEQFKAVFRAGASTYLLTSVTSEALVSALSLVMTDHVVLPASAVAALCDGADPRPAAPQPEYSDMSEGATEAERERLCVPAPQAKPRRPLSSREGDILQCIVRGDSNKHIARRYDIAEATVKVHVKAILRKIGVQNRTQAAIWALSQDRPQALPGPAPHQSRTAANVLPGDEVGNPQIRVSA
jgi:two-component system, NarL family, nitrate/nitrite response regulator NarL